MQSLRMSKRTKPLSDELVLSLERERFVILPAYSSRLKSLSAFLKNMPGFCNASYNFEKLPWVLIRHTEEETFRFFPFGVWANRILPRENAKSTVGLEEQCQLTKDLIFGTMKVMVQTQSAVEYIVCAATCRTNPKTGETEQGLLLAHSNSSSSERRTFIPYVDTEADGLVFGKYEWEDTSTKRLGSLREQ